MTENYQHFENMQRRYREGNLPWDAPLPPPEVVDLAQRLMPGRALDLGCGPGRACIYLAQRGWQCDGVDFVAEAIDMARSRAADAGIADRVRFHHASVTNLAFLEPPYDLAIDVGCMHALSDDELPVYAAEIARLIRSGGRYLLFARLRTMPEQMPRGVDHRVVQQVLDPYFTLDRSEAGETVNGVDSWSSAWFWWTRR